MKVIVDNNLSPKIARALSEIYSPEHEVVALRAKFPPNTTDEDWINALSLEGRWIVISGDRRITRNKAEYAAFRNSRLVGFFLARGLYKAKGAKQMERLLALWENVVGPNRRGRGDVRAANEEYPHPATKIMRQATITQYERTGRIDNGHRLRIKLSPIAR